MKQLITLLILISFQLSFAQKPSNNSLVIQLNSLQFQKLIKEESGTLLDVRTKSEFNAEHIENSGQLNFYAFDFKKKLELLPRDQPIYFYCNTGYRSQKAAEYLVKKGYDNIYNLEHGIMEWNLYELPVIEGDKSQLNKENMLTPEDYRKLIESEGLVFFDFYAPWCAPCRKMMPMIDSLKTEYHEKVKIVKVNADVSKRLVKELKIIGVPYFTFYKNKELLYKNSGTLNKNEIKTIFDKNLNMEMQGTDKSKIRDSVNNNFKEPLKPGSKAPNFQSTDQFGKLHSLNNLLKEGPVVMIFYRGQWCPVCNKHLAQIQEGLIEMNEKGAQIIAVTPEKPEYIDKTIRKTSISYPVLYDKDYKIMKLYRVDFIPGKKTTMTYNTFLNANLKKAHSDDSQTLPIPATYIIGTDGTIKYVHFNPDYKNRASIEEILKHL